MPIYEYRCRDCGAEFEVLQRMGDDGSALVCPECGRDAPERLISAFASGSGRAPSSSSASCGTGGFTCGL